MFLFPYFFKLEFWICSRGFRSFFFLNADASFCFVCFFNADFNEEFSSHFCKFWLPIFGGLKEEMFLKPHCPVEVAGSLWCFEGGRGEGGGGRGGIPSRLGYTHSHTPRRNKTNRITLTNENFGSRDSLYINVFFIRKGKKCKQWDFSEMVMRFRALLSSWFTWKFLGF